MGCYNCDNLDKDKKAAGKVSGNLYYCKKLKTFFCDIKQIPSFNCSGGSVNVRTKA